MEPICSKPSMTNPWTVALRSTRNYHVIGVHGESRPTASTASTEPSKEGTSYSIPTVQKILQRTNSAASLSLNKNTDQEQSKKLVKDAVVPLFGWARRKDIDLNPSLQSKLLDLSQQLDSMVVRDVWCVNATARRRSNAPIARKWKSCSRIQRNRHRA